MIEDGACAAGEGLSGLHGLTQLLGILTAAAKEGTERAHTHDTADRDAGDYKQEMIHERVALLCNLRTPMSSLR